MVLGNVVVSLLQLVYMIASTAGFEHPIVVYAIYQKL